MSLEPILRAGATEPPEIRAAQPAETGAGVIDAATFRTIEVDRLFDALNSARTTAGQAMLYRSLACPLNSIEAVQAKQEALKELAEDPARAETLSALLGRLAGLEPDFYKLLYGTFLGMMGSPAHKLEFEGYGYEAYKNGTRFMLDLVDGLQDLPSPRSGYLQRCFEDLKSFAGSRVCALMRGPAYRTEKGFRTRAEKQFWIPAIVFRPTLFKPLLIAGGIGLVALFNFLAPLMPFNISSTATPVLILFAIPLLLVYTPIVGTFDRDSCIYPLRDDFRKAPELEKAIEALGRIDELLAFHTYRQTFGSPMVLPEICSARRHRIKLKVVKNPILGKENPAYVGNDVDLETPRLTFISGPNSGGKTAICKTIAQTQLLAQIGCYVPAEKASLSLADRIFYQVPEFSSLEDGEGRFGTELKRTKAIFLACTERSLVILDELSEGTTYEEKLETSTTVLDGFYRKGNNTVLITHNHELVDGFQAREIGQACQVEFKNEIPTYKLIPGISRVSHADRVAKKIGFSKEDIESYLSDQGQASDSEGE